MGLSRRTVLVLAAGGALAGCRPLAGAVAGPGTQPTAQPVAAATASATTAAPAITSPTVSPSAPATASSPAEAPAPAAGLPAGPEPPVPALAVGRAEVVARYGDAVPEEWGLEVSGVITGLPDGARTTALTFDACGGPGGSGYDADLIDLLRANHVPATLFLNARWIDANPAEFEALAGDPLFEIANHGTAHRPLSVAGRSAYGIAGTRDVGEAYDEIAGNAAKLTALLGRPPRFFRSGTAHYDDVATRIVTGLGERAAGFTVNGDGGATFSAAQVRSEVAAAPPGAIVIAHMNHPGGGTAPGFAAALPALLAQGRTFVRLCDALA
ncbi:polysaccharide deacetylase family protein [Kitasatospora sp. NPDC059973]|uniref:polysaccharide deacetylase family protein n=1 Tax=Kitasatospora sp. NPDC059973 TaxID=3347020 RepID=UPI0036B3315B